MRRFGTIRIAAVCSLIGFIAAGATVSTMINASIGRHKLAYAERAEEGDPPEVAVGIAMGAFRGLFVNYLWIRANKLKEDGQYFEAIELSDAITRLQPRFPRVWVFHAWNMAYNISVATQTPQERWQWVNAGIRLLRDEAIAKNPNDLLIHKELSWIFLHKIQGVTDDSNRYYKQQIAAEWTVVLGPPPLGEPGNPSREAAIDRYVSWLEGIAAAPDTFQELVRQDERVAVVRQIKERAVGEEPMIDTLRRWTLDYELHRLELGHDVLDEVGPKNAAFAQAIHRFPELEDAWEKYINFLRKRVIEDEYSMDIDRMIRYTKTYGPIDWRHAAAHSLYWARTGVEKNLGRATQDNIKDFDFLNTDRMAVQSVQELFRSSEIYFDFLSFAKGDYAYYLAVPNVHFVDAYWDIMEEARERSVDRGEVFEDISERIFTTFSAGFQNFIADSILFFYRRGQIAKAEEYQSRLRNWPGRNRNNSDEERRFQLPIADFVEEEMKDRYDSPVVYANQVTAALQGAYVSGLLGGDMELFRNQYNYARQFHTYYMQNQLRDVVAGSAQTRMEVMPREFSVLAGGVFVALLDALTPDRQSDVFLLAPPELQLPAYFVLNRQRRPQLERLFEQGVLDEEFDTLFPEPPSYAQYEQERLASEQERRDRRSLNVERR